MSTGDDPPRSPVPPRPGRLAEPSEDELARHWSLTPADLAEVVRCRGDDHRRQFALQLCMVRAHGRFIDDYRRMPLSIVNHLSRQIGLPPVLFLDRPGRAPTETAQNQRIRRYLGLREFHGPVEAELRDWLRQGAAEGRSADELAAHAGMFLHTHKIILPTPATLNRLVASVIAQVTAETFEVIASRLPATLRGAIDLLVEVPEGDARSSLFRLKEAPKGASAAEIKAHLMRLELLQALLADGTGLEAADPRVVSQLGQLGRRYDAGDLRRFAEAKRNALVACYLVEARKTMLDQAVAMHDQFLTTMNRTARHAVEARHRDLRRPARDGLNTVLGAIDALLAAAPDETAASLCIRLDATALGKAATTCRAFTRL
jgi:uncharacterized protein DUF4158